MNTAFTTIGKFRIDESRLAFQIDNAEFNQIGSAFFFNIPSIYMSIIEIPIYLLKEAKFPTNDVSS